MQERMWLLRQPCLAGFLLQVLERGVSQSQAEADSGGLGTGRAVKGLNLGCLDNDVTGYTAWQNTFFSSVLS